MIKSKRRTLIAGSVIVLSLLGAACGDDSGSSSDTTAAASTTSAAAESTTTAAGDTTTTAAETTTTMASDEVPAAQLNASGATFPKAFYEEAIDAFQKAHDGVVVNYGGGGSGKGRQDLADQLVDWAGSDSPIKDEDLPKFKGGDVLYFPTVVAPITVSYNLDGVDKLQLSGPTLGKIFERKITNWNDAAIAADNPDAKLPDQAITVAHRSDSSGTTDNFTKFLVAAAGADWTLKSGSTVEWPADTQAGNGNAGVAQIVKDTNGAIGYVDLSDAEAAGLSFAAVKNKAGKFVEPTLEGATAAAEKAEIKPNLTYSAIWADGDAAYPITAQTWVIVYKKQTDKDKGAATKAFIHYLLSDGQKLASEVAFAALPSNLADQAMKQLDSIELPA